MPMIDMDWLRDHVDVPADETYEDLARDLVRVGLEEEEIHRSQVTGPIVVGYVEAAEPEPQKNGKTINWCRVDVGDEYNAVDENGNKVPRGIVCGAPNMRAGEKVVVTLPGAVLPGDFKIEPRKTYGHISDGMCASERELGLGDSHAGIILLREYGFTEEEYEALQPGDDAMALLHMNNPLLEINITPDRGYAFSYRGVAREFHHSTGAAFTDPVLALREQAPQGHSGDAAHDMDVEIDDQAPIHGVVGADRYYGRIVRGFNPAAPTPSWMRRRLTRAGMRSISLAVDVTNYVMLDLGQPLHAYDADAIAGPIVVRRAAQGETLTTLDEVERKLDPEDLLITDSPEGARGSRVLGLAGVMGGLYGEITDTTRNIFIEAAHFDQVTVARSSRRHKLPTEAARRFERGVDTDLQAAAVELAVQLLTRYGSGEASTTPVDVNHTTRPADIRMKTSEVARLTGLELGVNEISDLLTDVGCTVAGGGNGEFSVVPPTWRPDLTEPCDLVEEVARLVGYDKIPVVVPPVPSTVTGLTLTQRRQRWIANTLAEYGMVESLSYPFVGKADYGAFGLVEDELAPISVNVANPLAGDRPYLRRELLWTLATTVQRNLRRGIEDVALYELGHVYLADPNAPAIPALPGGVKPSDADLAALDAGLPEQPLHVAGLFAGKSVNAGWLGETRNVDYTDALEAVTRIGERLGVEFAYEQPSADESPVSWHPGRNAAVVLTVAEQGADGAHADSASVDSAGADSANADGVATQLVVGRVGELHPRVNEALGLPAHSAAFELDLTALLGALSDAPVQAKPVATYPPVRQDLAFLVPAGVTAAQVEAAIRAGAGDLLESVELFDVYTGDELGEGKRSLAYAVVFRSAERTLQSEDSERLRAAIIEQAEALGAQLRA